MTVNFAPEENEDFYPGWDVDELSELINDSGLDLGNATDEMMDADNIDADNMDREANNVEVD